MQGQLSRTRWETIAGAVADACAQGDYVSAETILRYAAKERELDRRIVNSLDQLLRACFEEKRYALAERIYWLGLEVKERVLGPNEVSLFENLDN